MKLKRRFYLRRSRQFPREWWRPSASLRGVLPGFPTYSVDYDLHGGERGLGVCSASIALAFDGKTPAFICAEVRPKRPAKFGGWIKASGSSTICDEQVHYVKWFGSLCYVWSSVTSALCRAGITLKPGQQRVTFWVRLTEITAAQYNRGTLPAEKKLDQARKAVVRRLVRAGKLQVTQ